uniref:Uncharacterized protein n=1 Tax=Arundo donax TaxID=35708 RepID=A0A0A8ZH86_ARUDO
MTSYTPRSSYFLIVVLCPRLYILL